MTDLLTDEETLTPVEAEARVIESHPYRFLAAGPDALMDLGLWEPTGDIVLLRAITSAEANAAITGGLIVAPDQSQRQVLEDTICYEIAKVGPVVQATQEGRDVRWGPDLCYPAGTLDHLRPGHLVMHLASGADAMAPEGVDARWHAVRALFVNAALDPAVARQRVADAYRSAAREEEDEARERLRRANAAFC